MRCTTYWWIGKTRTVDNMECDPSCQRSINDPTTHNSKQCLPPFSLHLDHSCEFRKPLSKCLKHALEWIKCVAGTVADASKSVNTAYTWRRTWLVVTLWRCIVTCMPFCYLSYTKRCVNTHWWYCKKCPNTDCKTNLNPKSKTLGIYIYTVYKFRLCGFSAIVRNPTSRNDR